MLKKTTLTLALIALSQLTALAQPSPSSELQTEPITTSQQEGAASGDSDELRVAPPAGRPGHSPVAASRPPLDKATEKASDKAYDEVVNDSAKSQNGIFRVHRVGERVLYEIPKEQLGRDFLLVSQLSATRANLGYGGDPVDQRVVRWTRRDKKILLENVDYSMTAAAGSEIRRAVDASNTDAMLFAFPIETESSDGAVVVDVTRMFLSDAAELSPKTQLKARDLEKDRCFLESVRAYPTNVEVESTLTLNRAPDSTRTGTATVRMHYSMLQLPTTPMQPRLEDLRVGFFNIKQTDFSTSTHGVKPKSYIRRWKLEKKNPTASLSDPVKPITFYIDPATPKQWVPFIKKGVEAWQPAFEEAGFTNGIVCLDAPKDADWSPEDARYSCIRWLPSAVQNAYGPNVCDPRSGEILEADVHIHQNVLSLLSAWYLTQAGPLDHRCRSLPLPDSLMGELLAMVVTHEVGHSLGLPHNMKGSSEYPIAKLRDPKWVKKMGHTPTVMDYCRFNYVAQPEDGIDPADLVPKIGPYDRYAIHWGYAPIPEAHSPEAEKPTLDSWARLQDKTPWLRFSTPESWAFDPGDQTESVGDADPVNATRLGLKNLKRVSQMLVQATSQPGEPYDELRDMWTQLLRQYVIEVRHVNQLVGGVYTRQKHSGQNGPSFTVVPRAQQREAARFVIAQALNTPDWLQPQSALSHFAPNGVSHQMETVQDAVMCDLLDPARLERLSEQSERGGKGAYSPSELLEDVRDGLFSELKEPGKISVRGMRRELQERWADLMANMSQERGEVGSLARLQLREMLTQTRAVRKRADDKATVAHLDRLEDCAVRQLDPRAGTSGVPAEEEAFHRGRVNPNLTNCWQDDPGIPKL